MSEARDIITARMEELSGKSFEELEQYEREPVGASIAGRSGRDYRLTIDGWTDEEDGATAQVTLRGTGLRRFFRLRGQVIQPHADDPEEFKEAIRGPGKITSRSHDLVTGSLALLVALLLIAPWFIGVGFLISLLI
jgi:hypothetical protein